MRKGSSGFLGIFMFLGAVKNGSCLSPAMAKQDTLYSHLLLGHTAPFLLQTSTLAFCASVLSAASQDSEAKRQGADAAVRGLPCCQSPDARRQQFCKAGERNEPGRCPMDALPCPDHVSFPDLSSPCPDLFYCSSPLCCVERLLSQ